MPGRAVKKEIVNVITLGCSKNIVDSEYLLKQIQSNRLLIRHNDESFEAGTVIINTCGFIKDAKQESIDTILRYIRARESGLIDRVYVMGCLSERYKKDLEKEIPDPAAVMPALPTLLRNFILKACRRDPAARYPSILDALKVLEAMSERP